MHHHLFGLLLLSILPTAHVLAEAAASPPGDLLIGQCAALSGAAQGLGQGMNHGLQAWIDATNASGGIQGRTLKLIAVDDAYDPEKCSDGTAKLIEEDQVFALCGFVGTPTAKVAIPIVQEAKVPLVGAFTGAGLLRRDDKTGKPYRYVINLRASYGDETEALVERLTKDLGAKRIACFYQNDSFGLAGLAGTEAALKKRDMLLAAKGTFERNTTAVLKGLADVQAGTPDAVVMVGPYKPITAFLKEAKAAKFAARFATVSFVGTENLIRESGPDGEGVVISQVVPSPSDTAIPLVAEYQTALAKSHPGEAVGYVSLEGFATGKLLGLGLTKAGSPPTREGLIDAYEAMTAADLGGLAIGFSPDNHQGSKNVYITVIQGGKAIQGEKLTP